MHGPGLHIQEVGKDCMLGLSEPEASPPPFSPSSGSCSVGQVFTTSPRSRFVNDNTSYGIFNRWKVSAVNETLLDDYNSTY